jgi:hypothetical protein
MRIRASLQLSFGDEYVGTFPSLIVLPETAEKTWEIPKLVQKFKTLDLMCFLIMDLIVKKNVSQPVL